MSKRIRPFLAASLLVLLAAGVVWGARVDPQKAMPPPLQRGDNLPDYLITKAPAIFQATIHSPYDTILGYTWYEYQHSCRIPRMNANDYQTPRALHFTFMEMEEPPGYRYVTYAYWDAVTGWDSLPAPRITHGPARAGYTGIDLIRPLAEYFKPNHSRAVVCYHKPNPMFPNPEEMYTMLSIEPNAPGDTAMWGGRYWYDVPDYVSGADDFHGLWPACGVDSLNRIHVAICEGSTAAGYGWLAYTRCQELPGDSLECCAPGKGCVRLAKETYYTDQNYEAAVVATSKTSNKVAVIWASAAETLEDSSAGALQNCNDVFYIESTNGGDDWQLASAMPPRINITRYQPEDRYRSYCEVTGVYDFDDSLHIFWVGQGYNQSLSALYPDDITLWHWSKATERYCGDDTLLHNLVTAPDWRAFPGTGGWNRTIAKIQSGIGIEGSNYNYLYLQWTQFDDTDENPALWNAAENFIQGEIYISLSTDLGFTWQTPVNVTNSAVDHCTSGVCASDHWGSMAERVDTCIYMQWVYDLDAGGYPQEEGVATDNPVLFRAFPVDSIPIVSIARIDWNPKSFADLPIHVSLNGEDTVYLSIENVGYSTLNVTDISSGAEGGWLTINPKSATLPPGGCPVNIALTVSGGSEEEFLVDSVRIQSNDEVGNNDIHVRLRVVVSDEYVPSEFQVVSNATYYLGVSNTGNLGHQVDTTGMYLYTDAAEREANFIFDGSPIVGFVSPGNDTLVGRYIFDQHYLLPATELFVDTFPNLKTIVAKAEFWPVRVQIPPEDQYWPWWRVEAQTHVFYSGGIPDPSCLKCEQYIALEILKLFHDEPPAWWVEVTPPATIPETYLGMVLDVDAPSDSGAWNYPDTNQSLRYASLQGYGGGVKENYRFAIAQRDTCYELAPDTFKCWPNPSLLAQPDQPYAMHLLRNDVFVYPQNGFRDDSLYKYMSTAGYSMYGTGEPEDYTILTTGAVIPAHPYPNTDTVEIRYVLAVSDGASETDLELLIPRVQCGNVDEDTYVGITDIVRYTGYLFRGKCEIWTYMGDLDGDGLAGLTDVVYMINYVLKSGPPPRCDYFR